MTPPEDRGVGGRSPLAAIDALRGVAALGVLLVHVGQVYALRGSLLPWLWVGDAGVPIFFVISGFLITTSALTAPTFDRRRFALARAVRILPLYYASMVVALVLVDPAPLFTRDGRADVAVHLVLLHGLFPGMRYSINGVWWSLTVEVLFYALVVAIAPLLRRGRWALVLGVAMMVVGPVWRVVAFAVSEGERTVYLVQQLPGAADQLGAGMVLAALLVDPRIRRGVAQRAVRRPLVPIAGAALVAVMLVYRANRATFWEDAPVAILWPLGLSIAVAACLAAATVGGRRLHDAARWSGLALVGTVSYGVYLFHPFAIIALGRVWFVRDPGIDAVPFVFGSLAGTLVVATMFHYSVERPTMAWGRRRTRPSTVEPEALAA